MLKSANRLISMKRFAFTIKQKCIRLIFIFGVLAGLFFSGGEGVHLLPFPNAEDTNSRNSAAILEKNPKLYALAMQNSGICTLLLKSNSQRQFYRPTAGGYLVFDSLHARADNCLAPAHNREKAYFLSLLLVSGSLSDRAPPAV